MTSASSDSQQLGPVKSQERVVLLDVLRALAVLGMFYVHTATETHALNLLVHQSHIHGFTHALLAVLANDKFRALFAVLMGVGMAVQVERAEARRVDVFPVYLRRLLFLWVLGALLNMVFEVDQLTSLAEAGLVAFVIAFSLRRRTKLLLFVTVWILIGQTVQTAVEWYERPAFEAATPEQTARRKAFLRERFREEQVAAVTVRPPTRTFEDMLWEADYLFTRVPHAFRSLEGLVRASRALLPFMLTGFLLWQIGVLRRSWERRRFFVYLLLAGGTLGLASSILIEALDHQASLSFDGLAAPLTQLQVGSRMFFRPFAQLGLDLAYISIAALLLSTRVVGRLIGILAPAGRMAFTNYILQGALPPMLFPLLFAWWLPASNGITNLIKATVVFGLLVLFSTWWLKRFRFGPFEWLWRSLTYWKLQPMRVRPSSPTT